MQDATTGFESLRRRHPWIRYRGYTYREDAGRLDISFDFLLAPDIAFVPTVSIEFGDATGLRDVSRAHVEDLIFHLGLIELISYWKAACPPHIIVEAGALSAGQHSWWKDLISQGLREFFFFNQIDFRRSDLVTIEADASAGPAGSRASESSALGEDLVMVSGGKDSIVSLELLRVPTKPVRCLLLNPTPAACSTARLATPLAPIVVHRAIDPRLLELNRLGYLNGHTPFSAYLAFLGLLCATLGGQCNVISSNEGTGAQPATEYLGEPVWHEYSKTELFERKFRDYVRGYLGSNVNFFSLLRPLHALQVAKLFSGCSAYHDVFRSCNRGLRSNTWCGACPKCVSTCLSLYPFMTSDTICRIFGQDFWDRSDVIPCVHALLGESPARPFECVMQPADARAAISLSLERARAERRRVPSVLEYFGSTGRFSTPEVTRESLQYLRAWGDCGMLPQPYVEFLRKRISPMSVKQAA